MGKASSYNVFNGGAKMTNDCLVLVDKEREKVTEEELKEVLMNNDGDLERFDDYFKGGFVWGYFCKILDYHRYALMDMDKIILCLDDNGDVFSYEHTGNYYPEHKKDKEVIGIIDENAEIEAI